MQKAVGTTGIGTNVSGLQRGGAEQGSEAERAVNGPTWKSRREGYLVTAVWYGGSWKVVGSGKLCR